MSESDGCSPCRWWRNQSGSTHIICPIISDFAWSWGTAEYRSNCKIFAPVRDGETILRSCNQFKVWAGMGGANFPTKHEIDKYLEGLVKEINLKAAINDLRGTRDSIDNYNAEEQDRIREIIRECPECGCWMDTYIDGRCPDCCGVEMVGSFGSV